MSTFEAVMIAEGVEEATYEQQLEAWAHLIKTGDCWTLQGYFGRTAAHLIDNGIISPEGEII
jgi:hypothetical protein